MQCEMDGITVIDTFRKLDDGVGTMGSEKDDVLYKLRLG